MNRLAPVIQALVALLAAGAATAEEPGAGLATQARRAVLEHTAWRADSLVVELAPVHLEGLPPETVFTLGEVAGDRRGVIPVLASSGGRALKRFSLGWRLRTFHRMPVAARELERGSVLAPADLELALCETTRREDARVGTELLAGARLKHRTAQGEVIGVRDVEPVPLVQRNQRLTLWYCGDGIELRLPARAQQSAGLGQDVPVRLEDSGRRITARVAGPGLVRVEETR